MKIGGTTRKPCHGCGNTGYRSVDKLCGYCQRLMDEAKAIKESLRNNSEMESYLMPWRFYSLPYIPNVSYAEGKPGEEFQKKFYELLELLAMPLDTRPTTGENRLIERNTTAAGHTENKGYVLFRKDLRDLLNAIYEAALNIAEGAFTEGKKRGQSLILGLASGEVSLDKFNEQAINKK